MASRYMEIASILGIERPELVIAFTAAVGTPLERVQRLFQGHLTNRGYSVDTVHLSSFMAGLALDAPMPEADASDYERTSLLTNRGNELRRKTGQGGVLAIVAAAELQSRRTDLPTPPKRLHT